jgi:hypothetical protein
MTVEELRASVEQQKALMIAVATGGPRIDDRQREYTARRREIAAELRRRGLADPNPYGDLWAWYGHWSANLAGYASRRAYISELYHPLLDAIDHLDERNLGGRLQEAVTGWDRVDDQLAQLRERFATANSVEDFQAVGLLCRDVFISLAEATFVADDHLPEREELPGPADAKRRLGFVVDVVAAGGSNQELRALLKATFDFANKVQHARAATLDEAALVAEATVASVNLMRVLVLGASPLEAE